MPSIANLFSGWATAPIADACVRLNLPVRLAPCGLRPVIADSAIAGPARPVRHHGSVDIFFEAFEQSAPGDVLVIDNGGRLDEGCIGDLAVLEARGAGIAGIVLWGAHRDTTELMRLALPVFSYGTVPAGPAALRPRAEDALIRATFGEVEVITDDFVFVDADGALFVASAHVSAVLSEAEEIWRIEREHARQAAAGVSLRQQFGFREYLARRANDPKYTLRQHLRSRGSAIEE
jgi:4-hydroxy-4-methyl-2-oxoglutarate aldolase